MDYDCLPEKRFFREQPTQGVLSYIVDLNRLKEILKESKDETVYAYIVKTVKWNAEENKFVQGGSGPNFQGGVITLCTCKHWMRASKTFRDWEKGFWIAGFTGKTLFPCKDNYLFYLMRVGRAFASHRLLWEYFSEENFKTRDAKDASEHDIGDLFRPKDKILGQEKCSNDFKVSFYYQPCRNHVHKSSKMWHKDIEYPRGKKKTALRPAALLLGEQAKSFLWFTPLVRFNKTANNGKTHPRTKKWKMSEFVGVLENAA